MPGGEDRKRGEAMKIASMATNERRAAGHNMMMAVSCALI